MSEILTVRNLSFSYNRKFSFLEHISINIGENERIGILGPNGSGKTTLIKILSGVLRNYKGNVFVNGVDLKKYSYKDLSKIIAVVPQNFSIALDYKVEDIILMGRYPYTSFIGGFKREDYDTLEKIIDEMDLKKIRNKNFSEISGGEAQRVIVAKALAQTPKILILDEFAAHLDLNHKKNLMDTINSIKDITLIGVYHDINLCAEMVDRIYFMKNGEIVSSGPTNKMMDKNVIEKVYDTKVNLLIDLKGKKKIFL
jgi:iron complex transport system ATP-binding protein